MSGDDVDPVVCRVALRYRDLDLNGHINHAAFHDLFDEARASFFVTANDGQLMDFVVRRVQVDYLAELRIDGGTVEVRTRVTRFGERSITFAQELVRDDGVTAAASVAVLVAFDPVERASRPITAQERTRLVSRQRAPQPPRQAQPIHTNTGVTRTCA